MCVIVMSLVLNILNANKEYFERTKNSSHMSVKAFDDQYLAVRCIL